VAVKSPGSLIAPAAGTRVGMAYLTPRSRRGTRPSPLNYLSAAVLRRNIYTRSTKRYL
jgi:hypothetical protein